jgi:hypothetical protein
MGPYPGRLLGYLFLTMFLAAAFGPFTGAHLVQQEKTIVYVSAPAVQLDNEHLEPFPEVKQAVEALRQTTGDLKEHRLPRELLESFIQKCTGREPADMCFTYEGDTYRVGLFSIFSKGWIRQVGLKETVPGVKVLDADRLKQFPQLLSYVNALDRAAEAAQHEGNAKDGDPQPRSFSRQPDASPQDMEVALGQMKTAGRRNRRRS